jgi:hypothetical protein
MEGKKEKRTSSKYPWVFGDDSTIYLEADGEPISSLFAIVVIMGALSSDFYPFS